MFKKNSSRSGLFLLELIISILFFSMASAVCIRLFVQAHVMDRDNRNLTQSVKLCENLAEVYTACNGDLDALMEVYPYFRRDIRSDIYVAPWRDMPSIYPLEGTTVYRFLRSFHTPSAAPTETEHIQADDSPADSESAYTDDSSADLGSRDAQNPDNSTDSDDTLLKGYPVQDMLMFLDRDFNPSFLPQSGGYVLCLISFELHPSAGTLKNVSFGVWEYDTMRQIPVSELATLTGRVDDDYFEQFSYLPEEDAIYVLDVTIYVPDQGGTCE